MLSQAATEEFLTRELRDSRRAKRLPEHVLDRMLEERGIETWSPPRLAQKVSLLLGMKYPSYLFLLGVGGGKSYITLNVFRNRKMRGQVERMLVLVPQVANLGTWEEQVYQHAPDCTVRTLYTDKSSDKSGREQRIETLEDVHVDIVVGTYQTLCDLCSDVVPAKDRARNRWKLSRKKTDQIAKLFDMIVLDESTQLRSHDGLPFKMVRRMREWIDYCYALTGTPFDKDPKGLWSQFYLIDFGHALGETFGLFRSIFFREEEGYWAREWTFRKRMTDDLHRRLAHCSVRFSKEECQDLPPAVGGLAGDKFMLLPVRLSKTARGYYNSIEKEYRDSMGSYQLLDSAYTRMRMISSGYIGAKTETGEKVELVFKENPKLDVVIAKVLELVESGEKLMIVHWFTSSGQIVADRLKKEKLPFMWIYGKAPDSKKRRAEADFRDPKGPSIMLCSTAISFGANLQFCRYQIYFETPPSRIDREQLEGRIQREGKSKETRFYYDAVCVDTKDVPLLDGLREGKKLHDIIVDGRRTK